MDSKDYKKLNCYLSDIFITLNANDTFLTKNIASIANINDQYLNFIDKYDLSENTKENTLTYEDVFNITREIIASIDKSYLSDYDSLIKSGKLDFGYNKEYNNSCFIHENNLININREFNFNDIVSLVHEFIHYTNGKDRKTKNRYLLTEFLSIYFEIYALEYLLQKGISKDEISIYDRLKNSVSSAKSLFSYELIFLSYEKFGDINENTINDLRDNYLNISKESFDQECEGLLNHIEKCEKDYKIRIMYQKKFKSEEFVYELCSPFFDNYRYLLGTLLAYYARKNCKIEDIIYLNKHINDSNFWNSNLVNLLKKINIDINDKEFVLKMFDSIDCFIREYSSQKVGEL